MSDRVHVKTDRKLKSTFGVTGQYTHHQSLILSLGQSQCLPLNSLLSPNNEKLLVKSHTQWLRYFLDWEADLAVVHSGWSQGMMVKPDRSYSSQRTAWKNLGGRKLQDTVHTNNRNQPVFMFKY